MTPKKKQKIKKAIQKLTNIDQDVQDVFTPFDKEVNSLIDKMKEAARSKTFDKLDEGFKRIQDSVKPILEATKSLRGALDDREGQLQSEMSSKYEELKSLIDTTSKATSESSTKNTNLFNDKVGALKRAIEALYREHKNLRAKDDMPKVRDEIKTSLRAVYERIEGVKSHANNLSGQSSESLKKLISGEIETLKKLIEEVRKIALKSSLVDKGGSMNRNILVDGTNYLKRYTDINIISGNNITIRVDNNDTLKTTDITFNSTGGGGGGGSRFIAQTPVDDSTYGQIQGAVNGSNTTFSTPEGVYISGTLMVFLRGKLQIQGSSYDWVETDPDNGTWDFTTAPLVGDDIEAEYETSSGGGGSAGGANTQVQFNDLGDLNGDSAFTWNKNTNLLTVTSVLSSDIRASVLASNTLKADTSAGVLIEAVGGTDIGILGAGNTANATWYGNHNFEIVSSLTVATFGASKTLQSTAIAASQLMGKDASANLSAISLGTNLSMSGSVLNATGGGTPGGADTQVQYNDGGSFAGSSTLIWNKNSSIFSATGLTSPIMRANRAVVTDSSSVLTFSTTTDTEIAYLGGVTSSVVSINNTQTLSNKTFVTPSIASFAQAQHNHQNGAGGGLLNGSSVFSMTGGQIQTSVLGTGTASNTSYLRGDNIWSSVFTNASIAGSTGTGVNDYGGATSFEIPNGAGGTTVDATGEVTIDSTARTLNFYDGSAEVVLNPLLSKSITIESPTNAEKIYMFSTPNAITITSVLSIVSGTSPSVNFNLSHGLDPSLGGTSVFSGTLVNATPSSILVGTGGFTDNTLAAGEAVWATTSSTSGTVNYLNLTVLYRQDP